MLGLVNVRYGLKPGEPLIIVQGREKCRAAVVKEYVFHILVNMGAYQTSINKVDLYIGKIKLIRKEH